MDEPSYYQQDELEDFLSQKRETLYTGDWSKITIAISVRRLITKDLADLIITYPCYSWFNKN